MNTAKLTMISASMALALGLTSGSVLADDNQRDWYKVDDVDLKQIDDSATVDEGNAINNSDVHVDNSDNRDLSDNSHSLELGDISLSHAVNEADLTGEVGSNDFSMSKGAEIKDLSNTVDGSAFSGASGLNQNVQNSGANSLVQQQVTFQGNLNVNK